MPPYYFYSGFSRYWYQHHMTLRNFGIETLIANGDWYQLLKQEVSRLRGLERQCGNLRWPLDYVYRLISLTYFALRANKEAEDLACFGWQCVAVKSSD